MNIATQKEPSASVENVPKETRKPPEEALLAAILSGQLEADETLEKLIHEYFRDCISNAEANFPNLFKISQRNISSEIVCKWLSYRLRTNLSKDVNDLLHKNVDNIYADINGRLKDWKIKDFQSNYPFLFDEEIIGNYETVVNEKLIENYLLVKLHGSEAELEIFKNKILEDDLKILNNLNDSKDDKSDSGYLTTAKKLIENGFYEDFMKPEGPFDLGIFTGNNSNSDAGGESGDNKFDMFINDKNYLLRYYLSVILNVTSDQVASFKRMVGNDSNLVIEDFHRKHLSRINGVDDAQLKIYRKIYKNLNKEKYVELKSSYPYMLNEDSLKNYEDVKSEELMITYMLVKLCTNDVKATPFWSKLSDEQKKDKLKFLSYPAGSFKEKVFEIVKTIVEANKSGIDPMVLDEVLLVITDKVLEAFDEVINTTFERQKEISALEQLSRGHNNNCSTVSCPRVAADDLDSPKGITKEPALVAVEKVIVTILSLISGDDLSDKDSTVYKYLQLVQTKNPKLLQAVLEIIKIENPFGSSSTNYAKMVSMSVALVLLVGVVVEEEEERILKDKTMVKLLVVVVRHRQQQGLQRVVILQMVFFLKLLVLFLQTNCKYLILYCHSHSKRL